MTDLALFTFGGVLGIGIGLFCRRNYISVFPNYRDVDMGILSKRRTLQSEYSVVK